METSESSNLTRLPNEYTLWFTFFKKPQDRQVDEFEDNLKEIGSFGTAEEFWGIYQHMKRPSSLPRGCEFFLFRKGVKPLWEDEANQGGGRCFISVKKNQPNNKLWEDLLISTLMLNKDFDLINGVVLNVRTYEVFISIWTKPIDDEGIAKVKAWMRTGMELSPDIQIEYRKHPTHEDLAQKQEQEKKEDGERKRRATETDGKKTDKGEGRNRIHSENLELKKPAMDSPIKGIEPVSEDDDENEMTPLKKSENPNPEKDKQSKVNMEAREDSQPINADNLNAHDDEF
jgi:translation initiation factor 4E